MVHIYIYIYTRRINGETGVAFSWRRGFEMTRESGGESDV